MAWRNCLTGVVDESGNIPSRWIEVPYTGSEGGVCFEPIYLEFSKNTVTFEKINYTEQNPLPVSMSIRNTSDNIRYRVNLSTDSIFKVEPTQFELIPSQSTNVFVSIPHENWVAFGVGKTTIRLQVDVAKL